MFVRLLAFAVVCVALVIGVVATLMSGDLTTTEAPKVHAGPSAVKPKSARPAAPKQKHSAVQRKLVRPAAPKPKRVKIERPSPTPTKKVGGARKKTANVFDIITIEPDGVSIFAGLAKPNRRVTVLADGVAVGSATTDAEGNWVLVSEKKKLDPKAKFTVMLRSIPAAVPVAAAPVKARLAGVRKSVAKPAVTVKDVRARMITDLEKFVAAARKSEHGNAKAKPVPPIVRKSVSATVKVPAKKAATRARKIVASKHASLLGGPVSLPIPIPIHFVYRTAAFTKDGEKAAHLLLEYLKVSKFSRAVLSGHADERGSHSLNRELSHDRLKTVRDFLRNGGFTGSMVLRPLGETKPFEGVDRSKFSKEELFQLDRRVELRLLQ